MQEVVFPVTKNKLIQIANWIVLVVALQLAKGKQLCFSGHGCSTNYPLLRRRTPGNWKKQLPLGRPYIANDVFKLGTQHN